MCVVVLVCGPAGRVVWSLVKRSMAETKARWYDEGGMGLCGGWSRRPCVVVGRL